MNSPYKGFKNITAASIKFRILCGTESTLEWLQIGGDIDLLKETIENFEEDEQYIEIKNRHDRSSY